MEQVRAAALYARISSDQEGTGQGVKRQLQDCRKLARELRWPVYDEYVDNDVSAFSGKLRPNYERMLEDVQAGEVDAVIVYNLDRLTRRPIEFEAFNATLAEAGVTQVRFVTGDVDLGTDDGLLYGRIQSAFAANESAVRSRRVRRKLDQVAAEGRPHGGSNRPFGFQDDKIAHKADEVAVIRQLAKRYLAGESLRSLTTWLSDQGVRTVRGGEWRTTTVANLLTSPRMAGLREHRGQVEGPAVWKPIITPKQRDRILAIMATKKASGRRTPRRYLLSGLLRCGKCGNPLYSSARKTTRRYVCMAGPDHGGCGRLTVVAGPVEELIAAAVLLRLDTPKLAAALTGAVNDDAEAASLQDAVNADSEQLDELAQAYGAKSVTLSEWLSARKVIESRMQTNQRKVNRLSDTSRLAEIVGHGDSLRRQWSGLTLLRQRAIIDTILDHVVIKAGALGARELDPARVVPNWRL